jgi:hypothetical protein
MIMMMMIMMMMMMMMIIIIIIINNGKECADIKVQNILNGRNNFTCHINCKYRTVETLYTLGRSFISGTSIFR